MMAYGLVVLILLLTAAAHCALQQVEREIADKWMS
jgi:hypothetical protein